MIRIGLLGLGTVGSGVFEIIENKKSCFSELLDTNVEIAKILVRDVDKKRGLEVSENILTSNPSDILEDPEIDVVVEVMGGLSDSYKYIKAALSNNKHVVTANKEVVSNHFIELVSLAKSKNRGFLFEASVGGGIPIIKPLKQCVKINDISEIKGILNGTTNFILTKMLEENLSFEEALNLAQNLGYAEANPTNDIEGYDVARKLAILSSIAFKNETSVENIMCRGVSSITPFDIEIFKQIGVVVRLLGKASIIEENFIASVEPVLIDKNSIFGAVKDAFNIVSITGNTVGELLFYGQGAGKNPTANAIVSDILDIVTGAFESDNFIQNRTIASNKVGLLSGRYYIRTTFKEKGDIQKTINLLNQNCISFKILNKNKSLVLITDYISNISIEKVIKELEVSFDNYFYARIA